MLLTRFEPSDVDNLLHLYGDPQAMRYLDNEAWDRHRMQTEILTSFLEEYERYARYGYSAAETADRLPGTPSVSKRRQTD